MTDKTYTTRDGAPAFLLGKGPLTKTFLEFQVGNQTYLVWAHDNRYRHDDKDHEMDILENE